MEELRQNPGENEVPAVTPSPDDALENVLDAWSSEPSSRQRYDRLRLERRDGESLVLLVDGDTARDLGDKLTIIAAKARHRMRGASGVPVDRTVDPGDAEDMARARKVLDLMGVPWHGEPVTVGPLADEFRSSREDVAKAHAMLDEQREKHGRELARLRKDLDVEQDNVCDHSSRIRELEAELAKLRGESSIDLSDPSEPAQP